MTTHIAFLRAINVGGTGKLPMAELRALCEGLGYGDVRTLIQSGNLVLSASDDGTTVRLRLEAALVEHLARPIDVILRSPHELRAILTANPFPDANPTRVAVLLANNPVDAALAATIVTPGREQVASGVRELYIHYPDGVGASRLKLPRELEHATVRNLNTLRRTLALAEPPP